MEWKLLIEEILDRLKTISSKQNEIEAKLSENAINDTKHEMLIEALRRDIERNKNDINDLLNRIKEMEKTRTEISGFAKYIKLIWVILAAIIGYYIQNFKH